MKSANYIYIKAAKYLFPHCIKINAAPDKEVSS